MKRANGLWRGITVGGLSLALVAATGLPISARAADNETKGKACTAKEHWQAMRGEREKMLKEAEAEDAQLQKLIAQLNAAPEAQKTDLEAQILNKLVAHHHQMVTEWKSMHDRMAAFRKEHMQASTEPSKTPNPEQK
jgi:site-specific recombinase XerC